MSYDIQGRTVLVTGAARGIGAAAAARLHARGANVALVGLEPERLAAVADGLGDALLLARGRRDRRRLARPTRWPPTVDRFGGVDVAIANAGVHWTGTLDSTPLERIEREIEINLLGVVRTAHAVLPQIIERKGYLLNIASLAAASHAPMMSAYAASKAGVEAFTDSIRVELAESGARVGCAYFGVIETDMVRDAYADPAVERAKALMPGFVARPAPLDKAVDAIEDGVLSRRARVWAPRYVGAALLLRGILQPLTEIRALRSRAVRESLAIARARDAGRRRRRWPATAPGCHPERPMASPVARKRYSPRRSREERREQVLDAALRVLDEHGFGGPVDRGGRARGRRGQDRDLRRGRATRRSCWTRSSAREQERAARDVAAALPAPPFDSPEDLLGDGVTRLLAARARPPGHVAADPAAPRGHPAHAPRRGRRPPRAAAPSSSVRSSAGASSSSSADDIDPEIATHALLANVENAIRLTLTEPDRFTPQRLADFGRAIVRRVA